MPTGPTLARATKVTGIVLLLGGAAHLAGVLHRFAQKGAPDGHRIAYLLFIAFIHWTTGSLDLLASGGLRRDEPWARPVLTVSTLLLLAYGATVSPLLTHGSALLRTMPVVYPLVHVVLVASAWIAARRNRGQIPD